MTRHSARSLVIARARADEGAALAWAGLAWAGFGLCAAALWLAAHLAASLAGAPVPV